MLSLDLGRGRGFALRGSPFAYRFLIDPNHHASGAESVVGGARLRWSWAMVVPRAEVVATGPQACETEERCALAA